MASSCPHSEKGNKFLVETRRRAFYFWCLYYHLIRVSRHGFPSTLVFLTFLFYARFSSLHFFSQFSVILSNCEVIRCCLGLHLRVKLMSLIVVFHTYRLRHPRRNAVNRYMQKPQTLVWILERLRRDWTLIGTLQLRLKMPTWVMTQKCLPLWFVFLPIIKDTAL